MITFVYCCICLLIICCRTIRTESEEYGYSNDSPDISPKFTCLQYKAGEDVAMRCKNHPNEDSITWEFKRRKTDYHKKNSCDKKNSYDLDYSRGEWKKLDFNRKRKKLEVKNITEENTGVYRCMYNTTIIKIYVLDLVVPKITKFTGPSPKIIHLTSTLNTPITANTPMVIQCKATSEKPAEIRWFKECNGFKCDVAYDGNCYCGIPHSQLNSARYINKNTYLSKLSIYNSRYVDGGTYICVVINMYGENHKNITVHADNITQSEYEDRRNSFSLLFLIPLILVLVPVSIWLCFNRRKKKNQRHFVEVEHRKQLIKPVVELDIVLNVDDVV